MLLRPEMNAASASITVTFDSSISNESDVIVSRFDGAHFISLGCHCSVRVDKHRIVRNHATHRFRHSLFWAHPSIHVRA